MPAPRYLLELEAPPDDVPDVVRLRKLLKRLLRAYGLLCVAVRELPADANPAPFAPTPTERPEP